MNFHFNGVTVVSPGGSIPPLGAKNSRTAEHKVTGSKYFDVVLGLTLLLRKASY